MQDAPGSAAAVRGLLHADPGLHKATAMPQETALKAAVCPGPAVLARAGRMRCAVLWCTDYYTLLRFLRARNYEQDKALKMWMDTLEWRREFEVDTILDNFVFHEREQFLMAYPQGYHKTDKLVSAAGQWTARRAVGQAGSRSSSSTAAAVTKADALPCCIEHRALETDVVPAEYRPSCLNTLLGGPPCWVSWQ